MSQSVFISSGLSGSFVSSLVGSGDFLSSSLSSFTGFLSFFSRSDFDLEDSLLFCKDITNLEDIFTLHSILQLLPLGFFTDHN